MDNYDKIIFVIENRGWKNGKLIEFIKTSKNELNKQLVDENILKKLEINEKDNTLYNTVSVPVIYVE